MNGSFPHIALLLVLLVCLRGILGSNSGVGEPQIRCKEAERHALLRIKQNLVVFSSLGDEDVNILLSSWGEEEGKRECCNWIGIKCSNISGHVINLDLSRSTFDTDEYSLRDAIPLVFLDVSYNQLSGELHNCWSLARSLRILVLANNNLSLKIPPSIGFLIELNILHLGNNNFTGELPSSLINATDLVILDVGGNKLSGTIPSWIGISLTKLIIFSLWSNHFNGSMPSNLCHLVDLQLLDLSSNDISGEIPKCLGNITSMKGNGSGGDLEYPYSQNLSD